MKAKHSRFFTLALWALLTPPLFAQPEIKLPKNPYKTDRPKPDKIKGLKLVWNDEFEEDGKPDPQNWDYEHGFVRNNELQWYQPDNAICKDGRLILTGKLDSIPNPGYNAEGRSWQEQRPYAQYSSACVITQNLQEFEGEGYYEVRAKLDTAGGSWPAIWLLGTKGEWPHNGEIDMLEFYRIDGVPHTLANVAWGTETRYKAEWDSETHPLSAFLKQDKDWADKYHVWGMWWDESVIKLYLDNELMNEIPLKNTINPDGNNPFLGEEKYYILLNLALGSNGGTPDDAQYPITFEVDYVRVYAPE